MQLNYILFLYFLEIKCSLISMTTVMLKITLKQHPDSVPDWLYDNSVVLTGLQAEVTAYSKHSGKI